jgi:type IX secretion system substrate protein
MKNVFIAIGLVLCTIISLSQSLPNNEFNSWISYGAYEEPEFWKTINSAIPIPGEATVFKSTDAYSGDYSVKLETRFLFGFIDVPGVLTLAEINISIEPVDYSISGGLPLKENVSRLTGMYKYSGADNDSATVLIYNYKRDNNNEIDTIGFGVNYLHDASDWTPFTVNMVNFNNHIPDTFNVVVISSGVNFNNGSVLHVDSLEIETNTGIFSLNNNRIKTRIYPNPTTDIITIETHEKDNNRVVTVYNISGKKVLEADFSETYTELNVENLPSAIYSYNVRKNNRIIAAGSFIKN